MGMLYLSLGLHRQQCNLPADVETYVICGNQLVIPVILSRRLE